MKIIFRYGEADTLDRIRSDQKSDGVKTLAYYPECGKGQKGQRAWVIDRVVTKDDVDIVSSSDVIFGELRLCVARKLLRPEDLVVYHYEKDEKLRLRVLQSGRIDPWPNNFMAESVGISLDILRKDAKSAEAGA